MKKLLIMLFVLAMVSPAFAVTEDAGPLNVTGVKLDAPDLIKFSDDISIGVEASKNLYQYINGEGWLSEDGDRGWTGMAKMTVKWTILDLSKK